MGQGNPKFRSDLTIRQHQTAAGISFVVKDPATEHYFFLREAERFIAQQLDGETPLEAIRQRTEEKFGAALPLETLEDFVSRLEKAGLLNTGERPRTSDRQRRIRGSLLYWRFKMLDPSPFLGGLAERTRFFFAPQFVVFSAAMILLAAGITVANWSEYTQDLTRLGHFAVIPLFMAVIFFVVGLHEMAHALTCKHFGGEVREMGFLLIYFQPALYCDVSDAWLFPEKSKRLLVSFAGGYFELFIWALATVAWRVSDPSTWVNYLALVVMTGSGIKTLLNFNPLIKLDGYYLLSDYLEIPNLRKKAFRYVGALMEKLWWGGSGAPVPEVTARERRIYLAYGAAATAGSFLLLGYVLISTGGLLIEGGQPLLLFLLTGLVGTRFRKRLGRLFGKADGGDAADDGDGFEAEEPGQAQPARPLKDSAGKPNLMVAEPPKKHRSRSAEPRRRRVLWVSLAVASLALLFFGRMELRIAGPFNILPEENADIRAAVDGIVQEVFVDEGMQVKAGQVLARLSDKNAQSELLKTEAEIRENEAMLHKLEAGPTAAEIELARAGVAKAEDQLKVARAAVVKSEGQLKYAQARLPRYQQLFAENLAAKIELEEAQQQVLFAENELAEARGRLNVVTEELAEAQGRLNVLVAGARPEEIEATRARIERLEAHRRYLQGQVAMLEVVSPVSGVVATPSRQLRQMVRQFAKKGDLIAKIYHFDMVTANILVSEKDIGDIRVGQPVMLRARAYPGRDFEGKVTFIATSAQGAPGAGEPAPLSGVAPSGSAGGNKMVLVTTEIDNRSLLLKPEMTGQAKMYCGERRIFDLVTRRLAQTIKVEFWSWW